MKRVLLWKAVYSQAPLLSLYLLLRTPRSDGFSYEREEVREKEAPSGPGSSASWTSSCQTALGHFPISSLSPTGVGWKGVSLCFWGQPNSVNDSWGLLFWQLLWTLGTAQGKTQGSGSLPVLQRRFEIWFPGSRCNSIPSAFWKCSPGWSDAQQRLGHIMGLHPHP